jgi:fatty-acyl-CoA synthase
VESLLDKSQVQQIEAESEEPRLLMLETIREYGLACLQEQGDLEMMRHAHVTYYLQLVEKATMSLFSAEAGIWFEMYDLSSLQLVGTGGASVPVALMEQVKKRVGADIFIGFGQTEATCYITATHSDDPFERKAATVGKPLPHTEVKIINAETGSTLPVGECGELCCRGYLVMAGYYKMPEKTAEAIDAEGWLHTADLATMDIDGYMSIAGRLKDMVIRDGENLFPREIEEFLISHPKVADVQVVDVPDAFFGEELLAVVIPKPGEQLSERELRTYCKGQISHQKIARYFQFVTSYPLTGSGKVQKFVLRENAIKAWDLEIPQQK